MRNFLVPLAILLCTAAPALSQVTVDLHALDALPGAPESPGRRPGPSLVPAGRPPAVGTEVTSRVRQPAGAAAPTATAAASRPAASRPVATATPPAGAASPPGSGAPGALAASASPTAVAPSSAPSAGVSPAAPVPAQAPPPASMSAAPPPVASIAPIQPPAPPANAEPPPPPPIAAGAGTTASATPAGLRLTFAGGKSDLSPDSADSIKHLVQGTPSGDATTFNVLAYATGDPDDPSVARRLSLERAIAVRSALLTDGVPSSRIYLRALGSEPGQGPPDRVDLSVLGANATAATGLR